MEDLREIDLLNKVRNKNRKQILLAIYNTPTRYSDLVSLTGLKPGSIYHHLAILEPLIVKVEQGVYQITDKGKFVINKFGLLDEHKPTVNSTIPDNITAKQGEFLLIKYTLILIIFIVAILSLLIWNGVGLVGGSLYYIGNAAWMFSLLALFIGLIIIFALEELQTNYSLEKRIIHSLFLRGISMVPGAIIGSSLIILFHSGVFPPLLFYDILFLVTFITGWVLLIVNIMYINSFTVKKAVRTSVPPISSDILIGIVILFTIN